ncbi:isochorismatase-like protein [Aureococcus anophagefferens]|nr:isochorismatase-like protein [Aureococcus anophagefferens]
MNHAAPVEFGFDEPAPFARVLDACREAARRAKAASVVLPAVLALSAAGRRPAAPAESREDGTRVYAFADCSAAEKDARRCADDALYGAADGDERLSRGLRADEVEKIGRRAGVDPSPRTRPTTRFARDALALPGRLFVRGEPGSEIVEAARPREGEPVIDKTANDAFIGTDLDRLLRCAGVRHLVVVGNTLDCCVHSTLRHANDLGLFQRRATGVFFRVNFA